MCHMMCSVSTLGKIFNRRHTIFLIFPRKQHLTFHANCLLWTLETICKKCQMLFSWKNKKNIINMSSAELAQIVVYVCIGLAGALLYIYIYI